MMATDALPAQSLAEVYLYLMATPCRACGGGPLTSEEVSSADEAEVATVSIEAKCVSCGLAKALRFSLASSAEAAKGRSLGGVNPTERPSRLLDVGQWITLYHVILASAEAAPSAAQGRDLKIEASQCLGEALKFFDDPDNDLPAGEAFFCETSSIRFRDAPEQFSRRRLLALRSKLPTPVEGNR